MKVRWALERGFGDDPEGTVYLALIDSNGENVPSSASALQCASEEEAKQLAAESSDGETLTWKPAPNAWQPDTYLVSNYYDDPGWDR